MVVVKLGKDGFNMSQEAKLTVARRIRIFFAQLFNAIDKKMEADAKHKPCCCKPPEGKNKSCCS